MDRLPDLFKDVEKGEIVSNNEDILLELDVNGNIKARYTHGPGIDEPLSETRDTDGDGTLDTTYYYHTDGLGSITTLTNSAGSVVQTCTYDTFGNIKSQTGAVENSYTYTGREWNNEANLYYYRARFYDANIGRFVTEDPIGFGGGVNFYPYVQNNPVNEKDPFGLSSDRDCSYYKKLCDEYGGSYYCTIAPAICKYTPDIGNWSDCVAECLQNFEEIYGCGDPCNNNSSNGYTGACTKDAHAYN